MALRSFVDGALFAEVYGEEPPRVLALHGWARRGSDFDQVLTGIPALAPDLPGFGASPAPQSAIGAEGYADIVSQILPAFDRPPVLVGHSFGGRIAVCLAARLPDAFSALVLTGSPVVHAHVPRRPPWSYRVIRRLNRIGIVSNARMERKRQRSGSTDYRSVSGVMRDVLVKVVNEGYEQQLRDVVCDVYLLWGSSDREVPVSVARMAADVVNQTGDSAQLKILDGVGHHVPLEAPEELRSVIQSYLE